MVLTDSATLYPCNLPQVLDFLVMASEALQAQAQAQATVRTAPTAAEKKIVEKKGGKNSPRGPQVLGTGTGTWAGAASEGLDERLALSVVEAIVEFSGEQTPIYSVLSTRRSFAFALNMAISLSLSSSVEDLQSCQSSGFHYFDLRKSCIIALLSLTMYCSALLIALLLRLRSTRRLSESPTGRSEGMRYRTCCWRGEGQ